VPQGSARLWAPFVGVVLNTAVMMVLLDQLYGEVCQQPATEDEPFVRLCFPFFPFWRVVECRSRRIIRARLAKLVCGLFAGRLALCRLG
jgi:hypothetical protein